MKGIEPVGHGLWLIEYFHSPLVEICPDRQLTYLKILELV